MQKPTGKVFFKPSDQTHPNSKRERMEPHRQFFNVGILGRWTSLSLKRVANLEPLQEQVERKSEVSDPRQLRSRIRTGAKQRHGKI
jgi:hypothetical protein